VQACQEIKPNIEALLQRVEALWRVIGGVSPDVVKSDPVLQGHLLGFFG